jgi:hypothetical protein
MKNVLLRYVLNKTRGDTEFETWFLYEKNEKVFRDMYLYKVYEWITTHEYSDIFDNLTCNDIEEVAALAFIISTRKLYEKSMR